MVYPREYISSNCLKILENKTIIYYGPYVKDSKEKMLKEFKKYDYILVLNNWLDNIYDVIADDIYKFKFLRCFGGSSYFGKNFEGYHERMETIKRWNDITELYFLTSVERIKDTPLENFNMDKMCFTYPNIHIHNLNNPHLGIHSLTWLYRNNVQFKKIKFHGMTFLMNIWDLLVKEDSTEEEINEIFENRKNIKQNINKYLSYKTKYLKGYSYLDNEIIQIKSLVNYNQYSEHGIHNLGLEWNFLLQFFHKYQDKVKLDKHLLEILKKYPNKLKSIWNNKKFLIEI